VAEELAGVGVGDADVEVCDEEHDWGSGVAQADADVVEVAVAFGTTVPMSPERAAVPPVSKIAGQLHNGSRLALAGWSGGARSTRGMPSRRSRFALAGSARCRCQ
jgi:hypothetical protein